MVDRNFKQEACQVYIEQEIDVKLEEGMTPSEIGKELTKEVNILFKSAVKPATIKKRAQRTKSKAKTTDVGTFVPTSKETSIEDKESPVSQVTQTSPTLKKRYTLRLSPELVKEIEEYESKYNLKQAVVFVELLEFGLKKQNTLVIDPISEKILKQINMKELQDVVSKASIIAKDIGADQSAAEIINLGLDVFSKK
ncbi:MAG: hypothetical protein E3J23_01980 [Candidatus Stahlbacteria bacterium]|nr:MAG: hypothetical protein E3J23_01980 [Candidatus Stahlbacteria bacterium]